MNIHEINAESFYGGMINPLEYEEELTQREETIKECDLCDGEGSDETISECCGATRDADTGLCHHCKDHCDPSVCPDCNGTGIITN